MLIFCKREDIMSSQRQIELLWQPDKKLREPDQSLTKKIIVFDGLIKLKIACFVIRVCSEICSQFSQVKI